MSCANNCKCCQNCGCRGKAAVSKPAPQFEGTAVMPDGQFKTLKLSDYKGKYLILYFYPLDFTFVCPSEILAFDKVVSTLKSKNVELLGCSVDSHYTHHAWRSRKVEEGGIGPISHPLLADLTKKIANDYGVLLETGVALRGLFLIDTEGVLRHAIINDLPLGRSVDEALRMVDALQYHEKHGDVCPANWKAGQRSLKATAEGVAEYLRETMKKTSA